MSALFATSRTTVRQINGFFVRIEAGANDSVLNLAFGRTTAEMDSPVDNLRYRAYRMHDGLVACEPLTTGVSLPSTMGASTAECISFLTRIFNHRNAH